VREACLGSLGVNLAGEGEGALERAGGTFTEDEFAIRVDFAKAGNDDLAALHGDFEVLLADAGQVDGEVVPVVLLAEFGLGEQGVLGDASLHEFVDGVTDCEEFLQVAGGAVLVELHGKRIAPGLGRAATVAA